MTGETPSKHTTYVWDHFCAKAAASHVAIIAHSAGGICTMDLLRERGTPLFLALWSAHVLGCE
jgi:hypothetical protein